MITIDRNDLLNALGAVSRVITRTPLPILENVLIAIETGKLTFTASNLAVQAQTILPNLVDDPESYTVGAKKLLSIVKSLPGDAPITLASDDASLLVTTAKNKFKLATLSDKDFPIFPSKDFNGFISVEAGILKAMLNKVSTSMGINDARHYLNGLLLHITTDKLAMVGTDGHRLAYCETEIDNKFVADAILPREFVQILTQQIPTTDQEVRIHLNADLCEVECGNTTLTCKLVIGKYPDWERVIPQNQPHTALLEKKELLRLVMSAMALKEEKHHGVKLSFTEGQLTIATQLDSNSFSGAMDVGLNIAEEISIGVDANYLLDSIKASSGDNLMLSFTDHIAAIVLRNPDDAANFHVIMPMRL